LDIARPRTDLSTPWALRGRAEIESLQSPQGGFEAWRTFVASVPWAVPTVIWHDDPTVVRTQVEQMIAMGRGVILRLRRSRNWNLAELNHFIGLDFGAMPLIIVLDHEQLQPNEDLTVVGLLSQNALLSWNGILTGGGRVNVFAGSSFPSQFSVINPEYALIDMRERQLHAMLSTSPPIIQAGIDLKYGDYA
jgi:hypothetical protein